MDARPSIAGGSSINQQQPHSFALHTNTLTIYRNVDDLLYIVRYRPSKLGNPSLNMSQRLIPEWQQLRT